MKNSSNIPLLMSLLILLGAILGVFYIDQKFLKYLGSGSSALAAIKHSEAVEVAGTTIEEGSFDLKGIIQKNQSKVMQIEREDGELGSGFLYNDKGDIITNAHIVEGATTVLVRMSDNQTYNGTVIGIGEAIDVAVVRVQELENLEPMSIASSYEAEVGDPIIAMGSPRGYQNTVTTGIVSAVNRDFSLQPYRYEKAYQISAPIAQGSSGGPLLLATTGEVVGINSAAYQGEVIGFTIPIKNIWSFVTAWSNGEYPEEPMRYNRTFLNEEAASYLVHNFYKSISNYDYLSAFSLLGSEWQSSVSYDQFRSNYYLTYSTDIMDIQTTIVDDIVNVIAEIRTLELAENEQFIENTQQIKYEVGIENDNIKILTQTLLD